MPNVPGQNGGVVGLSGWTTMANWELVQCQWENNSHTGGFVVTAQVGPETREPAVPAQLPDGNGRRSS